MAKKPAKRKTSSQAYGNRKRTPAQIAARKKQINAKKTRVAKANSNNARV